MHTSDFDNYPLFNSQKRCNLDNAGNVLAYYGDPAFSEDGSNGQVMVEREKFWYKVETDITSDRKFRFYVADAPLEGYSVHPNFIRNGVEKDKIYFAAFEGNVSSSVMSSIANVKPSTDENVENGTIDGFRGYAEARGVGWSQRDMLITTALQLLMLIEYGTFDLQSTLGKGIVDKANGTGNESENTGATSSFGNQSGRVAGTDGLTAISYRGVENPYGNVWEYTDGLIIKDDGWYWEDDITNFNDTGSGYNHVSGTPIQSDGYVDDLQYISDFEFAFMPKSAGGTSSTHITDYVRGHGSGEVNIARVGAYWLSGLQAGAFFWGLSYVASDSFRIISARLLYIPQE
jgi:hypothetical protein